MIKGNRVAVILAAYNGINWIEEQIQSILAQEEVQVTIFVSVDSSTDGTEDLVRILCNRYANIIALPFGYKFGGAARNFYRLLEEVDYTDFDFVSLSDQDDIWYPRKLINAIGKIREDYDFYSSNVLAFWPNGKRIVINSAKASRL
jgi:rhamnosyltransferase